ncbi:MAG: cell wall hydrolase [Oscillospiraceae bacterium]
MTSKLKRIIALVCVVCLTVCLLAGAALADEKQASITYTDIPMYVDGTYVGNGMKIDTTTYVGIRAFCNIVSSSTANISWDQTNQTVGVELNGLSMRVTVAGNIVANGTTIVPSREIINMNGTVILPIRDIAKVFNAGIYWNDANWCIGIDLSALTYGPAGSTGDVSDSDVSTGDVSYTQDDLYWLSRLIYAEAGNQPLDGKIGVGNVVLNRVASPDFPNTIYDVIFDTKYGVQFSVTSDGSIYNTPSEEAVQAAKMCLNGSNTVANSIAFLNPQISDNSWFQSALTYVTTIADHEFYA